MNKILLSFTDIFAQCPNWALRFKRSILLVLTIFTLIMFYGISSRTVFDLSAEAFMQDDNPAQLALDEFRRQFGSDRSVFIIYKPTDGDVFSVASLTALQQLTVDLENWQSLDRNRFPGVDLDELIHIRRVQSLANIRLQESVGDALLSGRLLPKELPSSEEERNALKTRAMAQPDYLSSFYSVDGGYGGILVKTDFGTVPVDGYESAVDVAGVELADSFSDFDM